MTKGGPRPGAGAPKGNLNALKHGRRSATIRNLITDAARELRSNPEVAEALRALTTALAHCRAKDPTQ